MDDAYLDDKFFVKYEVSLKKAVDPHETPVKSKHIRSAIMGTFKPEPGARMFWSLASRLPALGDRIVAWKLCHVVHKILHEGHPLCLVHSIRQVDHLDNVGKMWSHVRDAYGKLIRLYTRLLIMKLRFHDKNQRFPGHLGVTKDELNEYVGNDPNAWFELTIDMFDYLDSILELQCAVFGSLDMSRFSSMTVAGQCRLAPLIPCILEAARIYDSCVKILFKLHNSLSPELLIGHRDRFLKQFRLLKAFYKDINALQYFKDLISVPTLPDHPPDFLIRASLQNYVTQVVEVIEREPPEEVNIAPLVDTSNVESNHHDAEQEDLVDLARINAEREIAQENELKFIEIQRKIELEKEAIKIESKAQAARLAEYEDLIHKLQIEPERLRQKITELHRQVQQNERQLREQILNLESELAAKDNELENERQLREDQVQQATSLDSEQKARDEKFNRLKDVYTKLREEHITLIRQKAEVEKKGLKNEQLFSDDIKKSYDDKLEIENQLKTLQQYLESENGKREDKDNQTLLSLEHLLRHSKQELDNPALAAVTCTADYLRSAIGIYMNDSLEALADRNTVGITEMIKLSHVLSMYVIYARATCNADLTLLAPEEMTDSCKAAIDCGIGVIRGETTTKLRGHLTRIAELADGIDSGLKSANEDLGDNLEDELQRMDKAVGEAAARIADMLNKSKSADKGIKLEVNGKILDACTDLMAAIQELVRRARGLQSEIVAQGNAHSTDTKDFYKRNHRWTDGLISAAKSVAAAAQFLVGVADRLVNGDGVVERVAVAAQEIAACTAHLVVASRVKAARNSENLQLLTKASKAVSNATGAVVATSKACAVMVEEDAQQLDVSQLSLHQAKKLEMETKVRVLQLEVDLEMERRKLATINRDNYQSADD